MRPDIQTVILERDSLDLSKLQVTPTQRAILAQVILDLNVEAHIPCPNTATYSASTDLALLSWHFNTSKGVHINLDVSIHFPTNKTDYSITSSTKSDFVTYEQFIATIQSFSLRTNSQEETN